VRRYIQNFAMPDERRRPPWDAVIEFWSDNANCTDLGRTRRSVVDEVIARQ